MSINRFYPHHLGAATVGNLTVTAEACSEIERSSSDYYDSAFDYVVVALISFTFTDQHGNVQALSTQSVDLYVWRNSDNELRYGYEIDDLRLMDDEDEPISYYTAGFIDGLAGAPAETSRAMKNAIHALMRDSSFRDLLHAALNDYEKEF